MVKGVSCLNGFIEGCVGMMKWHDVGTMWARMFDVDETVERRGRAV